MTLPRPSAELETPGALARRDPLDVVDRALAFVGTRRILARSDVMAVATMLAHASCGETATLIVEFEHWTRTLRDEVAQAVDVIDALLDMRLALTRAPAPA